MKNSEICRAAMPNIYCGRKNAGKSRGMCSAILTVDGHFPTKHILSIVFTGIEKRGLFYYYYPTFDKSITKVTLQKRKQGYTSRIVFLELAALMWEEEGN